MPANPIDLTTVANVKQWLDIATGITNQDQNIQDLITDFSSYALKATGRGPADGSVPATSPFVVNSVAYDDFYDGSGTDKQPIRNWPINTVSLVSINGISVAQSTNQNTPGWVVDMDKKFISLRGGGGAGVVATFGNYRGGAWYRGNGRIFAPGNQNIEVQYTAGFNGTPYDLEMCARKTVALRFKGRAWIGQKSQMMANGAGTVIYGGWEFEPGDYERLLYYQRRTA